MPKKTSLTQKISNSIAAISTATKLVGKNIRKQTIKKPAVKKKSKSKISLISSAKKLINNPILQAIGQKLIEINTQNELTIYTHNICWTQSKVQHIRIAEKIESLQPDIVCLQEVVFQSQSEIFSLPRYHKSVAHSESNTIVKGGLVIYSKKNPLCVNFIKFEQQGKIFSPQLAERQLEKGFLVVEFEDYLVINIHLVADHSKKWLENKLKSNSNQIEEFINYIQNMNFTKPIIICGDLNFTPLNNSYKKLLAVLDLTDFTIKLPYTFIEKKVKLDYIITNQPISSYKTRTIRFTHQEPSDHLAVYSQIVY